MHVVSKVRLSLSRQPVLCAPTCFWSKRDFWITRSFRSTPIWIRITSRKWRSAAGISMHTKRLEQHELDKVATATLAAWTQIFEDRSFC